MSAYPPVKTVEEFRQQPEEYQAAVRKIVRSHALNELYGATVFDDRLVKLLVLREGVGEVEMNRRAIRIELD